MGPLEVVIQDILELGLQLPECLSQSNSAHMEMEALYNNNKVIWRNIQGTSSSSALESQCGLGDTGF